MTILTETIEQGTTNSIAAPEPLLSRRSPYKPFGILRFVLALMVLIQHYGDAIAPEAIKLAVYPWGAGNIAVLGFFIISGFIICEAYTYNYWERPGAYFLNRLLRIVPVYWAAVALSIAVHYALLKYQGHVISLDRHDITMRHFRGGNIFKNFILLFHPVRMELNEKEFPFVPYAWALQVEMMFYFTVFVAGATYKVIKAYVPFSQGFWLALAGFGGIALSTLQMSVDWMPGRFGFGAYFAFGGALFFFLSGQRKALFVLVPAVLQMIWHFQTYDADDFVVIPAFREGQAFLMLAIIAAILVLAVVRVKNRTVDRRIGDLSYPLYLNHYVIGILLLNLVDQFSLTYLAVGLAASIVLSQIMFWIVEKPLVRVRREVREGQLRLPVKI